MTFNVEAFINTPRRVIVEAHKVVADSIRELGGCDHSVGICMCAEIRLQEELAQLLALPASSGPEQPKLCEVAACHCGRQEARQFVTLADGKEYAASEQCALNHLVAGYAIRPINTPAPAAKEVGPRSE